LRDLACLLVTGALSLLAACFFFRCSSLSVLNQPWYTFNDVPLMQAWAKVAAEGEALPWKARIISRLNAPFQANWCDFPTPEELLWDFNGLLTRQFGVITGHNLSLLISHLLAGCSFYLAARLLGSARAPAVFCAVSFSMTRFMWVRDTVHINLSYCWHVPLLWVSANWFWQRRPLTPRVWAAQIALAAVTAWQNPYFWFFWLVMLVPCWLIPLAQRQWKTALGPLLLTGISTFFVFLGQLDSLLGWMAFGKGHPFVRSLNELQLYSLRLPEFLLPYGHRWVRFDEWATLNYYLPMSRDGGEKDSSYLGFLGIAAMLYLVGLGLVRLWKRQPVPFAFGMGAWLSVVCVSGGLTMAAGSLGFLLFRCTGRCSIVLQAGLLLFLALRLTRWRTFTGKGLLLLLPLLVFSAWDCIPPYIDDRDVAARYVRDQRATVEFLESRLPPRSMVFQWPMMEYPESFKNREVWHYEHLMAYLYSKDLRFSYGNCRNRPENQWQYHLVDKSPDLFRDELQRYGFSALWLYTKGLTDSELAVWKNWRQQPDFRSPEGDLWVYLLQPQAHPELPKMEPCRVLSPAFYGPESDPRLGLKWRWVWGRARIDLLLPDPCPYRFSFGLSAISGDRTMDIRLDGKLFSRVSLPAQYGVYRQVEFDLSRLKPGDHRLELIPSGAALPPAEDGRRLTFQYINEKLEPLR
jgi:phosphoglycerol transferase